MSTYKITFNCDICEREYEHGHGRYEGHRLTSYGNLSCCDACWQGNWDGWAPHLEPILLEHLREKGLPEPERNEKGLLPRN